MCPTRIRGYLDYCVQDSVVVIKILIAEAMIEWFLAMSVTTLTFMQVPTPSPMSIDQLPPPPTNNRTSTTVES